MAIFSMSLLFVWSRRSIGNGRLSFVDFVNFSCKESFLTYCYIDR